MPQWQTTHFLLDLKRPLIMGIVNNTPDSFSDGGKYQGQRGATGSRVYLDPEAAR